MSPKRDFAQSRCTWNNGEKAVVDLIECSNGDRLIQKVYKPNFARWMFRESFSLWYVSKRLNIVPKLVSFMPAQRKLIISYIRGQRALEWVLEHFGDPGLDLEEFRNCKSLDGDDRITEAFRRFRDSSSPKALTLKESIKESYAKLHSIGWQHGTSDPRNVIYDGERAYIIDFDHARPSLSPRKYDYPALAYWFGIQGDWKNGVHRSRRLI